jgi:hypothetical protein
LKESIVENQKSVQSIQPVETMQEVVELEIEELEERSAPGIIIGL